MLTRAEVDNQAPPARVKREETWESALSDCEAIGLSRLGRMTDANRRLRGWVEP